jgi:murein DD-endopeptidase MepM/ murein hydrolase activator NlpD
MESKRPRQTGPTVGFLIMLWIMAPFALGDGNQLLRFPGGTEVEIVAPILEPGQIILVRLRPAPDIRKLTVRFGDATYELGPQEESLEPFALIGLDLGLKSGPYDFEMTAVLRDGRTEKLKHRLLVTGRDFPVKKLWVKEEFVRPPAEVQDRIRREAEILEIAYSVSSERWLGEGMFERPHPGEMSPNFGEKRIYNNVPRSTHSGVDIAAPYGSPVRASNSGRVVLARDLYFSGKTVIIDHGLGLFTFYCHFSRLKVSRGEIVKKGAIIALAGSTGRSTGPHLHWGVRLLGSRVDPSGLLSLVLPE